MRHRKRPDYQDAMAALSAFFEHNIVVIYFFYGLAFFSMGLLVWLESGRAAEYRLARAMSPLAGFGIIHGLHEWFEMFQRLGNANATNIPAWLLLDEVRSGHLVLSFVLLIIFGARLIYFSRRDESNEQVLAYLPAALLLAVWGASVLVTRALYAPEPADLLAAADVLSRYILGIPGALLAAWAIVLEQRTFRSRGMPGTGRDLLRAALALALYGLIGQMFPARSFLFPANVINAELFLRIFGVPIQLFRAAVAATMAIFITRALRALELERRQNLAAANEARLAAQREALEIQRQARAESEQLNRQLRELLHQIVSAQERERQRIARELHDGTGQTLTGLGLGFAAAAESVQSNPALATRQLVELKKMSMQALQELRHLISNLRPSMLDDLGLVPALQGQVQDFEARTKVRATFTLDGRRRRVQPEIETTVFRIAQEALTNVAKHAAATNVAVHLTFADTCLRLVVQDDGRGFDLNDVADGISTDGPSVDDTPANPGPQRRSAWGLLGIQERVALVGGNCQITSQPGAGTIVQVCIPLNDEGDNVPGGAPQPALKAVK
ncbi:MAG TPA: sensor histidine kinase [Anaerolineae bacterium]